MRVTSRKRRTAIAALTAALAALTVGALGTAGPAAAKEDTLVGAGAPGGVALHGSPSRYVAISPRRRHRVTVVERIEAPSGRVKRWWNLRGGWMVPAGAYGSPGTGLSADESTLVLTAVANGVYRIRHGRPEPPPVTRLALLNTEVYLRHPVQPGTSPPRHAVKRIALRGSYEVDSVSPDGSLVYLRHYLRGTPAEDDFRLAVLDAGSGRLLPGALGRSAKPPRPGVPASRVADSEGRWAYTLYYGPSRVPFVGALDTADRRVSWIGLPQLKAGREPFGLRLRLADHGSRLLVVHTDLDSPSGFSPPRAAIGLPLASATASASAASPHRFLDFLATPVGRRNLLGREGVAGHSAGGRPIRILQWGDPRLRSVLVVGCVHGDECAARRLETRFVLTSGCPDPDANLDVVPDLDPDGFAAGTRLNGDGVDLNRNFAASWRPLEAPGDPEYSGPRPFSEPESRLAARIVRRLRPAVTIWFHQHLGRRPFVRAWGQSVPAARRFARLAKIDFKLLPWPDGTAPNWQNHRFPGSSSFVVELPAGTLAPQLAKRLGAAEAILAHRVSEDGHAAAEG